MRVYVTSGTPYFMCMFSGEIEYFPPYCVVLLVMKLCNLVGRVFKFQKVYAKDGSCIFLETLYISSTIYSSMTGKNE